MKKFKKFSLLSGLSMLAVSTLPIASCSFPVTRTQTNKISVSKSIKITFKLKDTDIQSATIIGNTVATAKSGRKFGIVDKPKATKPNCSLISWVDKNNIQYFDTTVLPSEDIVLYANFSDPVAEKYSVNLFLNGGSFESQKIITRTVSSGTTLNNVIDTTTFIPPENLEFDCWCDEFGNKISDSSTEKITKNRNFSANWKESVYDFSTCSWTFLNKWCEKLENNEITEAQFCSHFTNKETVLTSLDDFIGLEKTVQLTHQSGDIYQTVRVVGTSVSTNKNGDVRVNKISGTDKIAALTFEFKEHISDANGNSICTFYNNVSNLSVACGNYLVTSMRKMISSETEFGTSSSDSTGWYTTNKDCSSPNSYKDNNNSGVLKDNYNKSVYLMLPEEVKSTIKKTDQVVITYTNDSNWQQSTYSDFLFLPNRCNLDGKDSYEADNIYQYYSNANLNTRRQKHQVNFYRYSGQDQINRNTIKDTISGATGWNLAGYSEYYSSATDPYLKYGARYWISSPWSESAAWGVYDAGNMGYLELNQYHSARPIAPMFCI